MHHPTDAGPDVTADLHDEIARRDRDHEARLRDLMNRQRRPDPVPGTGDGPYHLLLTLERERAEVAAELERVRAELAAVHAAASADAAAHAELAAEVAALRARVLEQHEELTATLRRVDEYATWAHEQRDALVALQGSRVWRLWRAGMRPRALARRALTRGR